MAKVADGDVRELIARARYCDEYGIFTASKNGKSVLFGELADALERLTEQSDETLVERVAKAIREKHSLTVEEMRAGVSLPEAQARLAIAALRREPDPTTTNQSQGDQ